MNVRPLALLVAIGVPSRFAHVASPSRSADARAVAVVQPATARQALSEPSLSPDGREIAFVAGGDIWTVPGEGGVARLLISHPAAESRPLWSPDGRQIAFLSTRTGGGDIYVFDLASGRTVRRTFDDGRETPDAWSADGRWLYFSSGTADVSGTSDVWRLPASGGTPAQVSADRFTAEYWGAPSPDGSALAVTARGVVSGQWWRNGHSHIDESEIWLVRDLSANTPRYERVTDAGNGKDAWPMWSPDGRTLYYMSDRSGKENLWARTLGGGDRALTQFRDGRVLWPQIARDGSAIVFERDYAIWRFDVAKGAATALPVTLRGAVGDAAAERQTLTQGFSRLAMSPDGRKGAFVARGDVFVVGTRDGGDAVRLSEAPYADDMPRWLPDSRRVVYASSNGSGWHLKVQDAVSRTTRTITTTGSNVSPRVSPDGRFIAYQRDSRELRVVDVDGTNDRRLANATFSHPPFVGVGDIAWSPDSRWIAYVTSDARGYTNVWVVPTAGGEPRAVSFGADANAGDIAWAPDGSYLLYRTNMRTEATRIVRVDLVPRTPRFREDQYRELFAPAQPGNPPLPGTPPSRDTTRRDSTRRTAPGAPDSTRADSVRADSAARGGRRPVRIQFEGIRQRASIVSTQGMNVDEVAISPDGRTLAFTGFAGGQQQLYALALDELARDQSPRALTTAPGFKNSLQWSADSRELWYLEGGRISALNVESRQSRAVATSAETEANFEVEKRAVFEQATAYLADNFFDERMNGVDWRALAARVQPYVEGSRSPDDLRRVLSLMIGELNASHLGITGATPGAQQVPVGRLGVRLDRAALEGAGELRVAETVAQGPAAIAGLVSGDRIVAVDGMPVTRGVPLDSVLMGKIGRQVTVRVASGSAAARDVVLRPVSGGAERALLYRQWVEAKRAYVARVSNGRLGYVHMADMGQGSLDQLFLDLDAENQSREGVVIDLRNNNGGFVNVYAIDVLARRSYLNFSGRNTPASPARISLGQRMLDRPTVLVVNQETLSDGEDFTEGYRSLGLGKVVGEPTAGWIIFTSNVGLLDGATTLRLPSTRVTDAQGKDMEMAPRPVDVPVARPLGESYSGRDSQLDAAVQSLLGTLPRRN